MNSASLFPTTRFKYMFKHEQSTARMLINNETFQSFVVYKLSRLNFQIINYYIFLINLHYITLSPPRWSKISHYQTEHLEPMKRFFYNWIFKQYHQQISA